MRRQSIRLLALLLALVAFVAACGSDSGGETAASGTPTEANESADTQGSDLEQTATFPVTVESGGHETTVADAPEAIVSMSASATEMLFAIDAGDLVIAADSFSNYPDDAPTLADLSAFDPNVEAIIDLGPDLVVVSGDRNDLLAGLEAVDVPALVLPAATTLSDTYDQIELLGLVTGHVDDATALAEQMRSDIDDLVASVPERSEPLTYFHELDDSLYTVTSSTFIGELYALAGLENVADAADPDGESFGYPQLSAEFLVEADPDLVFLADTKCCGQSLETFAERPGFAELTAVANGNVIGLDDDVASRWGPRIVDLLRLIVEATADVEA